jgi:hypothetical protein
MARVVRGERDGENGTDLSTSDAVIRFYSTPLCAVSVELVRGSREDSTTCLESSSTLQHMYKLSNRGVLRELRALSVCLRDSMHACLTDGGYPRGNRRVGFVGRVVAFELSQVTAARDG